MGLFTGRKKKSSTDLAGDAASPSAGSVTISTAGGGVSLPPLDLDKAAAIIEARQRGKMARRKTEGLLAFRAPIDDDSFLAKCLPCLQQKSE